MSGVCYVSCQLFGFLLEKVTGNSASDDVPVLLDTTLEGRIIELHLAGKRFDES